MNTPPELLEYLRTLSGRCYHCGAHEESQGHKPGCSNASEPQRRRDVGMARATGAHPADVALVDAAIKRACDSGGEFSANDFRSLVPQLEQPAVIGARIRAWSRSRRIKHVGYVPSTLPSTHSHDIKTWRAAA